MAANESANAARHQQPGGDDSIPKEGNPPDPSGRSPGDRPDEPSVEFVQDEHAGEPTHSNAEAELSACQDRVLRMQAEMENLRRRTARELADERRYAPLPFVRDLLDVLDNIDRAIEAGEKAPEGSGLLEGFRMVGKQLRSLLEKHGVHPIAADGEPFDPNFHEALLQQPSTQPSGTVLMVTKAGYQLYDRVVRPAQVIVSSGKAEGAGDAGAEE